MNNICRICLKGGLLSSVFMKNYNVSLCDMIEYCSNVKIDENDGLPDQICSNCVYKLGIAYHFKHSCESSDIRLRQYHGLQSHNRFNDVAVMTDPILQTHSSIVRKCKCKIVQKKNSTNYKRKPESEKKKRGPKPKPKQIHSCYQCQKEFRCQAQLEMHVRTHTGEQPYACLYCSRRFTQKHNLTIHMRIHTGEKPFQCEVCSKTFSAQSNLQAHLKIHTGQKDHVCSLCSKSFITSSELTRHMSKHSGVKNFKCNSCKAAYIHSRDLKLHKLKKHQGGMQSSKMQNEGCNNNSHIDIIGLDEGKDIPEKEIGHFASLSADDKSSRNHSLLDLEKEIFHPYPTKNVSNSYICSVCGEGFTFMTALVQHCLNHHKGYNLTQTKYYA
ncbi:zinc finger protein 501-like [Battus philenor]|uniref:zinc finger protein 501-like n=1 Tax=Battus philenor TaxID=42288 RepID=UPI0035D0BD60